MDRSSTNNILFITIDCLRADVLGCYGGKASTPNIDSIAGRGMRYQYAFAHGHFTKTTFPAIFSGTYPWQFGGSQRYHPSRPNLVESLQAQGYATLGVNSNPWLSEPFGYPRGYSVYRDLSSSRPAAHRPPVTAINNLLGMVGGGLILPPYPDAESVTNAAIELLDQARPPYFLWLHYMDAHWPYFISDPRLFGPWDKQYWMYNARLARRSREKPEQVTPHERRALKSRYFQAIGYIDRQIGRLLSQTQDNTTIVLTSDHGEAFGEHGKYFHQPALYTENVRVPLILFYPGIAPGKIEPAMARHIDIAPTLLEIVNLPVEGKLEGLSLLSRATDFQENLSALSAVFFREGKERLVSLRQRGWTSITRFRQRSVDISYAELYNYFEDPEEINNLANRFPDRARDMSTKAIACLHGAEDALEPADEPTVELDEELKDRLRSLGYLE